MTELNTELEKQVAELQEDLKLERNRAVSLEERVASLEEELQSGKQQDSGEVTIAEEIAGYKTEVEKAQSQSKELVAKIASLSDELVAECYKEKADGMYKQIEELTSSLDAAKQNSETELQSKLAGLEGQLADASSYKSVAEQLEKKVEELSQRLSQPSEDVEILKSTLQQTETELQEVQAEVSDLRTKMSELEENWKLPIKREIAKISYNCKLVS